MSVHSKLLSVQAALKAPKGQFNAFGKYNYRSCEDILEAVKPLLKEHGLTLVIRDQITPVGDRIYVQATAVVTSEDGKDHIFVTSYAREEEEKKGMDGSQITGAASSYARKYALNGLFLIDDTKDSDGTNTHGKDTASPSPAKKPSSDAPSAPSEPASIMDKAISYVKSQSDKKKAYEQILMKYGEQLTENQKNAIKKFVR
jgi:hypothetical protein